MEKNAVIKIRDSLLCNNTNRAIRVVFDNGINLSLSSDLVVWDDDNEIIIGFTADGDSGSFEAGLPIEIICSTYENIQFIMTNTNVKVKDENKKLYGYQDLSTILDSLSAVAPITDEAKKKIIDWFTKVFSPEYLLSKNAYLPRDNKRGNKLVKLKEEE